MVSRQSKKISDYDSTTNGASHFQHPEELTLNDARKRLPIFQYREKLLYCIENYQTVVLVGETGCGKSTQIPQYLLENGLQVRGIIGVTQPKHISVSSLSERVASQFGENVGSTVGYVDKFSGCISQNTKIKFVTEEVILRELLSDPLLTKYSVLVVDEAHERSIFTDTLLGLLKKIVDKRCSFKLIITSATLDCNFFKEFYSSKRKTERKESSVVLTVEGRLHPVHILFKKDDCANYVEESIKTIILICQKEASGDILVFLADREDVLDAVDLLQEFCSKDMYESIIPISIYEEISISEQRKILHPQKQGLKKVIFATSIAETSITIPGIKYVIDCGFIRVKWFDPERCIESDVTIPISKASAIQRAGRAGRLQGGKVYRLYTEENFLNLPERIPSEIRRAELSHIVLFLKALGIENILRFNFPCAPPAKNLQAALESLFALGAIDEKTNLTVPVGYLLADVPLSPMLSKMLYVSQKLRCTEEIITIIAMLQVETVFSKGKNPQARAQSRVAKRHFEVAEGDLITLLNVYTAFEENGKSRQFCGRYHLIYKNLMQAFHLRKELCLLAKTKFDISLNSVKGDIESICKCIVAGFFLNTAYLDHSGVYKKVRDGTELFIHSSSCLYDNCFPQYVIYYNVIKTHKFFMRYITNIKEEWLISMAPHYYSKNTKKINKS